jgi:hypothetical protein
MVIVTTFIAPPLLRWAFQGADSDPPQKLTLGDRSVGGEG